MLDLDIYIEQSMNRVLVRGEHEAPKIVMTLLRKGVPKRA